MANDHARPFKDQGETVCIGLLGCGHVGEAFVRLVDSEHESIARRSGFNLDVVQIAVRDLAIERPAIGREDRLTDDAKAVVDNPNVDIVVELIGGIKPARTLILGALAAGKPVVSANKELLANNGRELFEASEQADQDLLFEGAVAGAIPLLRALRVSLRGEQIQRIIGIVNGTTNYILTRMSEEKVDYGTALADAQRLGYAERNPSADVEGFDAASKAAIIAAIAFNADVSLSDVYREGIESVALGDIEFAKQLGYEVKLLAVAEQFASNGDDSTQIAVRVHPTMVPVTHPLAGVRGPFNAVFVEGANSGELMFYGRGAGGSPTASAVLGDVLNAAGHLIAGGRPTHPARHPVTVRPMDELVTQYYISIDVSDQPGVLAEVATVFGRFAVSIRSMEQVGLSDEARLVFITHSAREADLQATLRALRELTSVRRIRGLLRVIDSD